MLTIAIDIRLQGKYADYNRYCTVRARISLQ